jgi:hypothetical protein
VNPAFAVLLAAVGVGFGHAVLPDHWVPLAVLARTQRYSLRRTLRLSTAAAITHVIVSLALGAILIMIGLQFRATVQHHQDIAVGGLLALTGVVFVVMELAGRRGGHGQGHGHGHSHGHGHGSTTSSRTRHLAAVMIPFGAAASPDLTILPVFLAASAIGTAAAVGSVIAFAIVTAATIVGLTVTATIAGYQVRGGWVDKYANVITALALLVIGILILAGAI